MNANTDKHGYAEADALIIEARDASERWDRLTNNHDPSFQRHMREAFVSGYLRGYRAAETALHESKEGFETSP